MDRLTPITLNCDAIFAISKTLATRSLRRQLRGREFLLRSLVEHFGSRASGFRGGFHGRRRDSKIEGLGLEPSGLCSTLDRSGNDFPAELYNEASFHLTSLPPPVLTIPPSPKNGRY